MAQEDHAQRIEYLHPTTRPVPGPLARTWLAAWPWWFWLGLAALGLSPFLYFFGGVITPEPLYMWPVFAMIGWFVSSLPMWLVAGVKAIVHAALAKHYYGNSRALVPEERVITGTIGALTLYWLVVGTPLAIRLGVACRSSAFESLRASVTAGTAPSASTIVFPFRITHTELYEDNGHRYVVLYTSNDAGSLPGGGSGFIHVPEGAELPGYNTGADGRAFGQWHWFTTD